MTIKKRLTYIERLEYLERKVAELSKDKKKWWQFWKYLEETK